jgi:hypothetical protein
MGNRRIATISLPSRGDRILCVCRIARRKLYTVVAGGRSERMSVLLTRELIDHYAPGFIQY